MGWGVASPRTSADAASLRARRDGRTPRRSSSSDAGARWRGAPYLAWVALVAMSAADVALTMAGLEVADGLEVNPVPAALFAAGAGAAIAAKVAVLVVALLVVVVMERDGGWKRSGVVGLMAAWTGILALVNLFSVVQLIEAGVFSP